MGRWEPDAAGRLRAAALDLFEEHGYDGTTVEDIASRAGVTKRTFFRHYADKREVLFGGDSGQAFVGLFAEGLAAAGPDLPPEPALAAAIEHVAGSFGGRWAFARRRQRVLAANASLRERELVKMATVAQVLAGGLRDRGVAEPAATVAAEAAEAVFRTAFERWVEAPAEQDLVDEVRTVSAALRGVLAGG
ncbi:Transcriptional regulator, TetR family [Pseudonocardia sp. Ae168_Ps1]|uniref:TetR/AcrR family transcriptional regulator n=1 Tax=unclassified Pseudonocardia TaxID=2619320 RepID=UPI00094B0079|nr:MULTISPECIES: TetR/AcrR family transcriptional regulator [unclassified Pseudonocardia]OLL72922.1 Transcriptional regulator, TetR family [Pseudonocardia sp. Ae150A_Ps1]OLL78897.1 Transcriptional regulator, TetR family [Pseudonocardia sp. Ae168_Ps1]OLL86963.1 Transcriptional regulator, TetR family [Pseudonocardia sp. Ae263_Ps1]OLL92992.1 Transcriptional regulator, TetR family [Pseudonocardia sp. Ae356_Ps1]